MEDPIRPDTSRMVDYMEHYRDLIIGLTPPGCYYVAYVPIDYDGHIGCVRPQRPMESLKPQMEATPEGCIPVVFMQQFLKSGHPYSQPEYHVFYLRV